jgi:hypothetical protein
MTNGTRGLLTYEFQSGSFTLPDRLFLIIGWHVPLIGDNGYFIHVAQVESPDFPAVKSERQRVFDSLIRRKNKAGTSMFCNVSPEVVDNQKEQSESKDDGKKANTPESWLTVCASMATT